VHLMIWNACQPGEKWNDLRKPIPGWLLKYLTRFLCEVPLWTPRTLLETTTRFAPNAAARTRWFITLHRTIVFVQTFGTGDIHQASTPHANDSHCGACEAGRDSVVDRSGCILSKLEIVHRFLRHFTIILGEVAERSVRTSVL
jgi:hypothetical protein